MNRHNLRSTA